MPSGGLVHIGFFGKLSAIATVYLMSTDYRVRKVYRACFGQVPTQGDLDRRLKGDPLNFNSLVVCQTKSFLVKSLRQVGPVKALEGPSTHRSPVRNAAAGRQVSLWNSDSFGYLSEWCLLDRGKRQKEGHGNAHARSPSGMSPRL